MWKTCKNQRYDVIQYILIIGMCIYKRVEKCLRISFKFFEFLLILIEMLCDLRSIISIGGVPSNSLNSYWF